MLFFTYSSPRRYFSKLVFNALNHHNLTPRTPQYGVALSILSQVKILPCPFPNLWNLQIWNLREKTSRIICCTQTNNPSFALRKMWEWFMDDFFQIILNFGEKNEKKHAKLPLMLKLSVSWLNSVRFKQIELDTVDQTWKYQNQHNFSEININ